MIIITQNATEPSSGYLESRNIPPDVRYARGPASDRFEDPRAHNKIARLRIRFALSVPSSDGPPDRPMHTTRIIGAAERGKRPTKPSH